MKYIYYGQSEIIKIKMCVKICPSNPEGGDDTKQNKNVL